MKKAAEYDLVINDARVMDGKVAVHEARHCSPSAAMGAKGVPTPAPYQIVAALVDKLLENGYTE